MKRELVRFVKEPAQGGHTVGMGMPRVRGEAPYGVLRGGGIEERFR
jgi:hypothetical protein